MCRPESDVNPMIAFGKKGATATATGGGGSGGK